MSFKVFFDLSVGVSRPISVPKGTIEKIKERVTFTEATLGFETEQYKDNPPHWKDTKPKEGITDEVYCDTVEDHNHFVRRLYEDLAKWSENPVADGEELKPEESKKFWHGLRTLVVPLERWTMDYFRNRMEELYETMRGRGEAVIFNSKPLTERQAADVFNIFSPYLDKWDLRLDVPKNHDYLASSYDGGYYWCEKCGAVTEQDAANCTKRKCPIKEEWGED